MVAVFAGAFSGTITLGSALIALVVLGSAGYFAVRGKAVERAEQTSRDFRENYLAEKERAESLSAQVLEQRELKHAAKSEAEAFKKLTDLSSVHSQIAELRLEMSGRFDAFAASLHAFEDTQKLQTEALQAIVAKLNLNGHP